ncbi:hypothetical protein OHA33_33080 [Streptomyces sp. NBC_00562]|uniref:hypothetical protein n=1 Tax=Streptomyces sp. NBC_00562 TaxID=2975777 RepID=UPI002E805D76|nr:hypothetical protein [Streptomyces sp. NBC_00562]WUC23301.1 hypothetical protein OHA33_33080 [Streptomyces sp. NBC_00562]
MSEEQRESATQTSEVTPDGADTTEPATEPADGQLGDAGKRALSALRDEIKALKAQLKAQEPVDAERDASESDSASDAARDAGTVEPTPQKPRFQGTGDGGAYRQAADANSQLTKDDLRRMSPAAIETARRNGRLRDLLSGK